MGFSVLGPEHHRGEESISRRSLGISAVAHVLALLLVYFGMPHLFDREHEIQPSFVTVEVLPITDRTNVKPKEAKPQPKKEEPKKEEPKPKKEEKPKPPEPKKEAPKKEPEPAPKKEEKKKPEPKKEPEKKKEKPKKEEEADPLAAILKDVAKTAKDQPIETPPAPEAETKASNTPYNSLLPMSISEMDAIRQQIAKCWNIPAGAKDARNLIVTLRVQVQQDGMVSSVEITDRAKYMTDNFFRAAAESAVRAVKNPRCNPLKGLPVDKYDTWKDMELTFDPSQMLY